MNAKYQVFVSSTYEDLKDERNVVIKAILEMGHIPVGMEMFSAADEEQWRIITRTIDESDYYIVIIAHRYGSTIGDTSYTEREYNYAAEQGIPILGFIIEEDAQWKSSLMEADSNKKKALDQFKEKVKKKPIGYWKSSSDLYAKCPISLMKAIRQSPRRGWVRATVSGRQTVDNNLDIEKSKNASASRSHQMKQLREEVLIRAHERVQGRLNSKVLGTELAEEIGVSGEDLHNEVIILKKRGLVDRMSLDGGFSLSAGGILEAERILESRNDSHPSRPIAEVARHEVPAGDPTRVFVVHGRDLKLRNAMFDFLSSIGLRPIEWEQAITSTGDPSAHIGEILKNAFELANAVVVLFSGDDLASLRDSLRGLGEPDYEIKPTPQARPNVLFEAGMAFGTHPRRTILVEVGILRPFSDIAGRHVVRMDGSANKRRELAGKLEIAGCAVDISGSRWLEAGDFSLSTVLLQEASDSRAGQRKKSLKLECNAEWTRPEGEFQRTASSLKNFMPAIGKFNFRVTNEGHIPIREVWIGMVVWSIGGNGDVDTSLISQIEIDDQSIKQLSSGFKLSRFTAKVAGELGPFDSCPVEIGSVQIGWNTFDYHSVDFSAAVYAVSDGSEPTWFQITFGLTDYGTIDSPVGSSTPKLTAAILPRVGFITS